MKLVIVCITIGFVFGVTVGFICGRFMETETEERRKNDKERKRN